MMERGIWRLLAGGMLASLVLLAAGPSSASAAPASHIFDPVLSLTGGCVTPPSADDEVLDPGCPYPPPPAGPSEPFANPTGLAIDSYGNVYVAVFGPEGEGVDKGHIDIFDSTSHFIAGSELHVADPENSLNLLQPRSIAVDSKGYLYVFATGSKNENKLLRYKPTSYTPASGEIAYGSTPVKIAQSFSDYTSLAVDSSNDHLFANFGGSGKNAIREFGSGEEGNPVLDNEVAVSCCFDGPGLAIDAERDRLYATDQATVNDPRVVRVFELASPHNLIETIDGSTTPEGSFVTAGALSLAVDEATGNLFAYDQESKHAIYELTETGQYLSTITHSLTSKLRKQQVAVDNGENSPNGALNPEGRYLWATAAPPGIGHAYAFKPTHVSAPEVEVSFSEVSEGEALLEASIDPGQAETSYAIEYVSLQQFEAAEFQGAQLAGQGTIPAGALPVAVSAEATGLAPGTVYVFRVRATNEVGEDEAEGEFKTYPAILKAPCPNDAFRTGPSAALPDCRAYELVTPPDTGGRPPMGAGLGGVSFWGLPASPAGERVSFKIVNGLIPGLDGTASLQGDPYLSARGPDGWSTVATGGNGTETTTVAPGGRSPDQTYSVWAAEREGPAVVGAARTVYLRYPDGHSELFGRGSLATDPFAVPKLISEGGGHMIFTSSLHLENGAQPAGKLAVYDRTADGITHVASLLPGDETPSGSQAVLYQGSSLDGRGIAFTVSEAGTPTLHLRYEDQQSYEIGDSLTFEGVAEGGKRVFYLEAGSLYAFDVEAGKIPFATSGDVTVVNVSADGTTAYFISPSKLTSAPNPLGAKAIAGEENLYRSHEGTILFVGTVSEADVDGEGVFPGLGLWADVVKAGSFAADPSRSTEDGGVLLFESDADLTPYDSGGSRQVYRFDSGADQLTCLSCNPTGEQPSGDALLQNATIDTVQPEPNSVFDVVDNLSAGGRRAFFQSPDPLVAADTDSLLDVYEWEAQGEGTCADPAGCLFLISSGRSEKVNYLYAASASGEDVFFRTSDRLVAADKEAVPSIYDARIGGGFPQAAPPAECEGEGCRPSLSPPPILPSPGSASGKSGNVSPKCPKGKRRVRRHGKVRCVKRKKHRHHRHHRPSAKTGRRAAK
jgi:hypothetical protein